jgi:uncharacterized membrane protein
MITDSSIAIEAPASVVWDVFANVEHWPQWTLSVERIVALNGPDLEVGKRFEIKQPRLATVVWEVTELDRGVSWTWRARSPGNTTLATHQVVSQGPARTLVRQRIEQRGPIGVLVGAMMRRLTRRYLELEAQGLKTRSEKQRRRGASAA